MKKFRLLDICLKLFDGGTAGTGAAAPGEGGASGNTQAAPAQGEEKGTNAQTEGKAPEQGKEQPAKKSKAELRKAYRELVNSEEWKEIHTAETQRIIDNRFREAKGLQEKVGQMQPLVDLLLQRYQVQDGDLGRLRQAMEADDGYWQAAAEAKGMSVEQYKLFARMEAENQRFHQVERQREQAQRQQEQLSKWDQEAEQVRESYPSFDLQAEAQDRNFLGLLKAGIPMRQAYELIHMEEIKQGIAEAQAKATEQAMAANIRAKGARPAENGTASTAAAMMKSDVSKMTRAERDALEKRVLAGERIVLS